MLAPTRTVLGFFNLLQPNTLSPTLAEKIEGRYFACAQIVVTKPPTETNDNFAFGALFRKGAVNFERSPLAEPPAS